MSDDSIIDFDSAKERAGQRRLSRKEKELGKQFKKAMGWKNWPKTRPKNKGSKGPGNPRGKKR